MGVTDLNDKRIYIIVENGNITMKCFCPGAGAGELAQGRARRELEPASLSVVAVVVIICKWYQIKNYRATNFFRAACLPINSRRDKYAQQQQDGGEA